MAKILITEDSDTIMRMMKDILTEGGHEIVGEAKNGLEAIEKYEQLQPDIVTLDISMPIMDGMEALSKIIEIDPRARILMVSSAKQNGNIPKSIIMGACEFIEKPFEKQDLLKVIAKIENAIKPR